MSTINTIAPDEITFRYDLKNLPVVDTVAEGYGGLAPNRGYKAQPVEGVVTIRHGLFSVSLHGVVVKADGERDRRFSYIIGLYGHVEIERELAQMVADRMGMELIGKGL